MRVTGADAWGDCPSPPLAATQPERHVRRLPTGVAISVGLTSTDLGRLNAALRILVSPHRYDHVDDWRAAVRRSLTPAIDAATRSPSAKQRKAHSARELAIARLLRPVYRAALRTRREAYRRDATWTRFLEHTAVGAVTFDGSGTVRHQNRALVRLLIDEPERDRVHRELAVAAQLALAVGSHRHGSMSGRGVIDREVRTTVRRYAICGMPVGHGSDARSRGVTVFVERMPRRGGGPGRRQRDYGLTPREREVAALLASGSSTIEVAGALGISVHTARRHAEHLLSKLGVHSRGAAVAKLRTDEQ